MRASGRASGFRPRRGEAADARSAYHGAVKPLLATSALRVDVAGLPAIDGLTLESTGRSLLILGAPSALFTATAGLLPPERGELLVDGVTPRIASREGVAAAAALDPPMPPRWTVLQYVTWSARLSGLSRARTELATSRAIDLMQLRAFAAMRLGAVAPAVRRGAILAAAIATDAPIVLLEDPFVGLQDDVARMFPRVVTEALADRRIIFFASRLPLDSPMAIAADEAIVVQGSRVVAQGPPTEIATRGNSFAVRVSGDAEKFIDALTKSGGRLLTSETSKAGSRFSVDLGALGTRDLLRLADGCDNVVLELRPLARIFA
jgi:ABC-type multidrug transport system ATPase subunit